jgi:hypothetical protein
MPTLAPVVPLPIVLLRPDQLDETATPLSWLWHGYLAHRKLTVFTSPPKSGKTTLLAHLLACLADGGSLAGMTVTPGRAIVVSEEATSDWRDRCRERGLSANVQFLCRPFAGARPTEAAWFALLAALEAQLRREPTDLVVFDPLATLLPGYAETCGPKLLDCLLPVQSLASLGPAVWLLHHPAKARRPRGQTARGTGALPGFVDIVMEMTRRPRSHDRRRRLRAYSRFAATPPGVHIELAADGSAYTVRAPAAAPDVMSGWPTVQHLLKDTFKKQTQQDLLRRWPNQDEAPDRSTLCRWLKRATQEGLIRRSGAGVHHDPYRYWLTGHEPYLFPGHDAAVEEIELWKVRCRGYVNEIFRSEDGGAAAGIRGTRLLLDVEATAAEAGRRMLPGMGRER